MAESGVRFNAPEHPVVIADFDGTIAQAHPDEVTGRLLRLAVEEGVMHLDDNEAEKLATLRETYGNAIDGSRQNYLGPLNELFDTQIHHKNVKTLRGLARDLVSIDQEQNIFYDEVLDEIRSWQERGATTAIISGSPVVYIREFAKAYGFDFATGTRHYHNGNNYRPTKAVSRAKEKHLVAEKMLTQVSKKLGQKACLEVAMGDTENDLSLLEAARQPIAVNPMNGLATIAKEREYRIIIPRNAWIQS
jgi:HAD superfamily phosphoserine phosphatase-like hydrolase